jgi:hypothetical protein
MAPLTRFLPGFFRALAAAALLATATTVAWAQTTGGAKIYCWKNAKGQTECGDRAPADPKGDVRELSKRGITVETKPPPPTPEQRKAQEEEAARRKVEQEQLAQKKRADQIMLDTYGSADEIELKRKREVGLLESRITSLETNIRNANERQTDMQRRMDEFKRNNKPVPPAMTDELAHIGQEQVQHYNQIARYKQEIAALNKDFAAQIARYREIKGTPAQATAATPPAPAAATPAAPAKK